MRHGWKPVRREDIFTNRSMYHDRLDYRVCRCILDIPCRSLPAGTCSMYDATLLQSDPEVHIMILVLDHKHSQDFKKSADHPTHKDHNGGSRLQAE